MVDGTSEAAENAPNLSEPYLGFLCYARDDDTNDDGRITYLRKAIQREFQMRAGHKLEIFQDKYGIRGGADWNARITANLDEAQVLIPIMTPSFLRSQPCILEVERFAAREDPSTLIVPIHYVEIPNWESSDRPPLPLLQSLQWTDFRELRYRKHKSLKYQRAIGRLADDIKDGLAELPSYPTIATYEPLTTDGSLRHRPTPRDGSHPQSVWVESALRSIYILQSTVRDAGTPAATVQYRLRSTDGIDLISDPVELREGYFNVTAAFRGSERDTQGRYYLPFAVMDNEGMPRTVTLEILELPEYYSAEATRISADLQTDADPSGRIILSMDLACTQPEAAQLD